jgi:hypothetical protein
MTEEIMPREDRMGKILSFIGGCIAGVAGVFAVAVMSEMSPSADSSDDSEHDGAQNGTMIIPESNNDFSK